MPPDKHPPPLRRRTTAALLALTLISSAIHFLDNAFRLDLYPGPPWLTRNMVLATWLGILLLAVLAYRIGTRTALILYATVGFAGLAHCLAPHHGPMPLRPVLTISAEAITSILLIACALLR